MLLFNRAHFLFTGTLISLHYCDVQVAMKAKYFCSFFFYRLKELVNFIDHFALEQMELNDT